MAEHIWTVFCDKVLVDSDTLVVSLINVAESVAVQGLDQLIEEAARTGKKGALVDTAAQLVSWWYRSDPDEDVLRVRFGFQNPDGVMLFEQTADVRWEVGTTFSRVRLSFGRLPVTMPGLHWFIVEEPKPSKSKKPQWARVARIPLHIGQA
jgi:hypothetical protein